MSDSAHSLADARRERASDAIKSLGAQHSKFGGREYFRLSKSDALAQALVPPTDATSYHAAFDRGPIVGPNVWDKGPPDGTINIVHDLLGVALHFGHSCA